MSKEVAFEKLLEMRKQVIKGNWLEDVQITENIRYYYTLNHDLMFFVGGNQIIRDMHNNIRVVHGTIESIESYLK